jgi:hypothetical protein
VIQSEAARLKASRRGQWLCRVSPALTIYLPEAPTGAVAKRALEAYYAVCPPESRPLVTGSKAPAFSNLLLAKGQEILTEHLDRMNRRKDQGIVIWDGAMAESWTFTIQGVPPEGGKARASFCQALFPNNVDVESILRLATLLADSLPFLSGHAGYAAHFNAAYKDLSFDTIYGWAKRYPGLEVEDLNVTVRYVLDAIKGANWLTLIGSKLWDRLLERTKAEPRFAPGVAVIRAAHGMILRAGDGPVLGDRNRRQWPELYVDVERKLVPIKLAEHAEFAGRFEEEAATGAWLRRLLEPAIW